MSRTPWLVAAAGLTVCLVATPPARAVAPVIKDDAKFFSEDAVKKANQAIKEIARKYGKDLLIETFPSPTGEQADKVKEMSAEERSKFYKNWAENRAKDAVVNGVYILITKSPARLEILITRNSRSQLNEDVYKKLRNQLLQDFRDKKYDDGLQAAVKIVRDALADGKK